MTKTYAIADLHGRVDVLNQALKKIAQHNQRDGAGPYTIVFLGDYIDRGPASREVISRLMEGPSDHAMWHILKGNHEDMCLQAHYGDRHTWHWWFRNGGEATMHSYGKEVPQEHLDWMRALPNRHLDAHRLYVHAGILPDLPYAEQHSEVLMWVRHGKEDEVESLDGLYVVHGHTPYRDGPVILRTRCNLDVLAYKTGKLSVGVFDDDIEGAPVEMIDVSADYMSL